MKGFGNRYIKSHIATDDEPSHTSPKIRGSVPKKIKSYRQLVGEVAKVSFYNPEFSLFYRGQHKDYKLASGVTSIYPKIYRKEKNKKLTSTVRNNRFEAIEKASSSLINEFKKKDYQGNKQLSKFPELVWAILQHYEVCKTPLLDVTHSLRVAASFALNRNGTNGFIFVLGFPHITGSISYSVEEEHLNIKLLSICPPVALRPYFQEAYCVGTFPMKNEPKHARFDVAQRLIAKYEVVNEGKNFWGKNFSAIPKNALYPQNDRIEKLCRKIKEQIEA